MTSLVRPSSVACAAGGVLLVLALLLGSAAPARAQSSDGAAALSLFEDGKRLTSEGDYAAACPKLLASYHLVAKLGTLLNLADCYEKQGLTASAWVRFTEATTSAERSGQEERAAFARAHAAALAGRLSRLVVRAPDAPAGELEVWRDGMRLDRAEVGTAIAVDPGRHTIEARAGGRRTWTTTIVLGAAEQLVVVVPTLEEEPPPPVEPAATLPPPTPHRQGPTTTSPLRPAALATAGVGGAVIAASLVTGLVALEQYRISDSSGHCVNDVCSAGGLAERDRASSTATISTGLFVGGAALVVAGIVLRLLAPVW